MTLTKQQLTERKGYVGASDAAAVCSVNPYASAYDVWLSKTGKVDDWNGNEATEAGSRLQGAVIEWASEKLAAADIEPDVFVRHPDHEFIAANLDAVFLLPRSRHVIVEGKTGGIFSPLRHDLWTDDDYPEMYAVQIQHQLACCPAFECAYLAALCPPKGFLLYRVERDPALIEAILEKEVEFWDYVRRDVPPPDCSPSPDVLKRIKRTPNKITAVDVDLVDAWEIAKAAASFAKKAEESAKNAVIAALGDAEKGEFIGGAVTYFETERDGYSVEPCKYRTLRKAKS